jgi:predicted RNase H-like HicB family nuclease
MGMKNALKASEYLSKQYARILTPDPSGVYVAQILEFPGCIAEGDSPHEAYERLEAAAESWIDAMLRRGQKIPEPSYDRIRDYSGKIALRLPRSLHRDAVRFAERENTSLNQFLVSSVSAAVGAMSLYEHVAKRLEQITVDASELLVEPPAKRLISRPRKTAIRSRRRLKTLGR